jgi:sortase A
VPVFDGTDDLTLNRGVGRIIGTAQVGGSGNLAIAGHRDGFFRALQDVARGDLIELVQSRHTDSYIVGQIRVVTPENISVLGRTAVPTLTLVTCFPFYYIGHAPNRFVVTAHLKPSRHAIMAGDPGLTTITKRRRNHDIQPGL